MSAPPFGYYDPPESVVAARGRPRVIPVFRSYAAIMALGYLGFACSWIVTGPPSALLRLVIAGAIVFGIVHAVAVFVPYRPWGWILGLVVLSSGILSFGIGFAIPILVFWLRQTCRAAFQRF